MGIKTKVCKAIHDKWIEQSVAVLTREGQDLIERAYEEAHTERRTDGYKYEDGKFANDTFNLKDSYGSAVYVYGQLRKSSVRFIGSKTALDKNHSLYGREEVDSFLTTYKASVKRPLELVCVAAIFYASDLERGLTPSGRKYIVISNIADDMQSLASRVKGIVRQIGNM